MTPKQAFQFLLGMIGIGYYHKRYKAPGQCIEHARPEIREALKDLRPQDTFDVRDDEVKMWAESEQWPKDEIEKIGERIRKRK